MVEPSKSGSPLKLASRRGESAESTPRRGIFVLPHLFTTAGLFFGFWAIVEATRGNFGRAAIWIFVAMVMDGLDGRVARLTNTASDFGKEYDSLADVICFGLAPALLIYQWALVASGKLGWLIAFLYVAATALRLARFNTVTTADKRFFQGLPCPAAAAFVASWVWVMVDSGVSGAPYGWLSLLVTAGIALSMVGSIPYRSFKELDLKGRVRPRHMIIPVLVLVIVFADPPKVLFAAFMAYAVSGPLVWAYRRLARRRSPAPEREEDEE